MKEKMKLLITLQDLDTHMGHILIQKKEGPEKISRLQQRLTEVENQLAEEARQVEACTRDRRAIEQKIEDAENNLKKANVKLSSIKSNKEYHAALKEIDELKRAKFLLEEKALELMELLESLEAKCAASREQAAEMKQQVERDREAVTRSLEALDRDLRELEKERRSLSQVVDTSLLRKYDALIERKGGIAVSPVVKGVCQTCHLRIPPQAFNELIQGDKLMTCPNCTRLVYWGDDDRYKTEENANDEVES